MKSLFIAVIALCSLSAHGLVAQSSSDATLNINSNYTFDNAGTLTLDLPQQNSVPPIAVGGTAELHSTFVGNFVSGLSYGSQYSIITAESITGNFDNSYATEVDVNGASDSSFRFRPIITGDSSTEILICPSKIIARKEDAGRTICLKKGEGGVISLEIPNDLSNQFPLEWRLAVLDQLSPLPDYSANAEKKPDTISIIGVDGNPIEVPDTTDLLKPIDIFKSTDATTGVVSYNFSFVAIAPGTTAVRFTLIKVTDHGNVLKDVEPFMIQVDDADSSSLPPSNL